MGLLIALVVLAGLFVLPQIWIASIIKRYSAPRPDMPETGAEFARTLLGRLGLDHVLVEPTDLGDHYDPEVKAVRLAPERFHGKSLAAVVIAAHEIGHAMQDATDYPPLAARTKLAQKAQRFEKIGAIVLLLAPLAVIILRSPMAIVLELIAGLIFMGFGIVMHAVTLPVEYDASFRRALPLLKEANLIPERDLPAARNLLRAAAFTYVAAAAMSLLNIARWFRVLRL